MNKFPIFDAHYDILQSPVDKNGKAINSVSNYAVNMDELLRNKPIIRRFSIFCQPNL